MALFEKDEYTGIQTDFYKDGGKIGFKRTQDVQGILDLNQKALNNSNTSWKGDMHHVASIPLIIIEQWMKELGDNPLLPKHRNWLVAKLNSSDFGKLRVKGGRI